jgi:hypothetical protein
MRRFFSWLFQRELKEVMSKIVEEIRNEVKDSVTKDAEERIIKCREELGEALEKIKKGIRDYHEKRLRFNEESLTSSRKECIDAQRIMVDECTNFLNQAETIDMIVESINKKQIRR